MPSKTKAAGYEARKEAAGARNRELSLAGRDIGPIPEVVDPERKAGAAKDLQLFCHTYLPQTFTLAWSPDHLKVIARIEQAVLRGGLSAFAMPRGSGKTSIAEAACLWAIGYGHRKFPCLLAKSEAHATLMLDTVKTELANNELLAADFPEVCHPIAALDGIANRCIGQLCMGEHTNIKWAGDTIVLPTIDGSAASGAIITVAGITGGIRGMKHALPDGGSVRPDLVLLDDPQSDESAASPAQNEKRIRILMGAVLGMAGPGKKIAGVMPCTVIRPGDMADSILDREKHPQWNGERTKMVYAFPTNGKLWEKYAELLADSYRAHHDNREGTAFYKEHREAMDLGAHIAWPERFDHDELSGLQNAMNLKIRDEVTFWAEYQNQPLPEDGVDDEDTMTADAIAEKINRRARGEVPIGADHMTAFIDIQKTLLYWMVVAWADDFTGYIVSYGTYPDQQRQYFTLRDATNTLARAAPGTGVEGSIYAGLMALTPHLLGREWKREGGVPMRINRCLIDANWGTSTEVVYKFCRESVHAAQLTPSHGKFVGASSFPMSEYKKKQGDRVGTNWRIPSIAGKRAVRHILYDTNFWKSFVHARLAVAPGDKGCLSIFGTKPTEHQLLAEQLTAEYRVRTEGRGRVVDEWKLRLNRDNHYLDCLAGCAVAASMDGATLAGWTPQVKRKSITLPRRRR